MASTTLTSNGQVTIPKRIRDALELRPGTAVAFSINPRDEVVLHPAKAPKGRRRSRGDRFEEVRGTADVKWRTDDLMKLLRGDDRWCSSTPTFCRTCCRTIRSGANGRRDSSGRRRRSTGLAISSVICAEFSLALSTIEALDGVVARLQLALQEIPKPAPFLAGKAFLQYRRRGGRRAQVLPDFSSARTPRFATGRC